MSEKENPPAFPGFACVAGCGASKPFAWPDGRITWENYEPGMTLRDFVAVKTLAAYIGVFCNTGNETPADELLAGWSDKMADAMIAARKENP